MADLLEQLKLYIDPAKTWEEDDEQQLSILLRFSNDEILNHAFPYGTDLTKVPRRYENLCVRAAAELYAKMGAEGQTGHSENGISRTWASATLLPLVQTQVIPAAKSFGSKAASEPPAPPMPAPNGWVTQEQLQAVVNQFEQDLLDMKQKLAEVDFAQKHIIVSEEFADAPALLAWVANPLNESKLRHGTELHTDTDEPNFRAVFNTSNNRWEAKESPLANKQWVKGLIEDLQARLDALEGK